MTKFFFCILIFIGSLMINAKPGEVSNASWKTEYRESNPRINDLVHTKLDVKFDYDKSYLYGKAWITLHPHFYSTDSLLLDAKGMDIKEVALMKGKIKSPLKYSYDSLFLNITLN